MLHWIQEDPYRAVMVIGALIGAILSMVAAVARTVAPESLVARLLSAAADALPANLPRMAESVRTPSTPPPPAPKPEQPL